MRLINIGPYGNAKSANKDTTGKPIIEELIDNMRRRGQLKGVEIDTDTGTTIPAKDGRDDDVLAQINVGVIEKIREYSAMNKYDAIVCRGSLEPGFHAGRQISKIPVAFALHSAVHVASLIGDRFSLLDVTDPLAHIARRHVEEYGFGHKLVSVRRVDCSSLAMGSLLYSRKKADRANDPQVKDLLDVAMVQCVAAIEKDRADTIIIGCIPLQYLEDEIRQRLAAAGYGEIQLICEFASAVEMAQVMVNMKVTQAPRAYPGDDLRAKPEYR